MPITTEDKIAGLYAAFFNRAADKSGFDTWVTKLENGTNTLDDIAKGFASHSMFTTAYGSLTNEEFVNAVYTNMTGSVGDTAGVAYYTSSLDDGTFSSRSDMVSNFVQTVLTTDLTDSKYDSLSEADKSSAQNRQTQLKNKTEVSQDFMNKLDDTTNPTDVASLDTDAAYLASIKILSEITHESSTVTAAQDTLTELAKNKSTSLTVLNKLDTISTSAIQDKMASTIESIYISEGNYTPGAIVDLIVTFSEDVTVSGTDSTIGITIGDYLKTATYSSKTADTITYKYTIEDGISDTEQTIKIQQNGLTLNNTTIQNSGGYSSFVTNELVENTNAIVNDNQAPSISVSSAYYISNTDKLTINGTGFSSILEQNEDNTVDLTARFDFTKLTWDIDGDDTSSNTTVAALTPADVKLINIVSDTELSIVLNPDYTTIESDDAYGHNSGAAVDTLDIATGFVLDKVGNISTDADVNNIVLGIDNTYYGDISSNTIYGSSNSDTIYGSDGDDILYGMASNDTLEGSNGDDKLIGGTGIDTLTGGAGSDTFVFSTKDMDSVIAFGTLEAMDKITDLILNGTTDDLIDLDITVANVNGTVAGSVDQSTFVTDMNTLLNIGTSGFNKDTTNDISATIVSVNAGDLNGKKYLVVDKDKSDTFTTDDFAIDITGVTITNFTTDIFV